MGKGDDGVLIVDSADKTPPTPARPPHSIISYDPGERRPPARRQLPPQVWILLTICALLPVVAGVAALWRFLADRPWLADVLGYGATALLALGALLALWGFVDWLAARRQRLTAEAWQAALARGRMGTPFDVRELPNFEQMVRLEAAAAAFELARAPYTIHPMLSTMSNTKAPELPALAAPAADEVALVAPDEWLPWLLEMPHAMIAGGTGAGKTTLARVAFGERLRAGYAGIAVDPKGKEWFGVPVVGAGRKFDAILSTLDAARVEMDRRFEAYGAGERSFAPLAVLVDEVPDIMGACLDDRRRLVDGRWARFVRQLGSLAREVQISVTLLTQSPLVEDIGMNSAMRKNFTRIALGDEAPALLREERDPRRRAQLQELLRGQSHPAAVYRRGQVHLLDTSTVPDLAARPVASPAGWEPPAAPLTTEVPLEQRAQVLLGLLKGDRRAVAERLLAQRGAAVRGGWRWEVKDVARALGMRDEEVSRIGRPDAGSGSAA